MGFLGDGFLVFTDVNNYLWGTPGLMFGFMMFDGGGGGDVPSYQ